jgi:hypothetical protein
MSATMTFSTQVQGYTLTVEIEQGSTNGETLGDVMKHVRKAIELCLGAGKLAGPINVVRITARRDPDAQASSADEGVG